MVQRYETIISAREEGFARTAQEVLAGSRQIAQAMEMLQRVGSGSVTPGAGAFAQTTAAGIGAQVRQYDVLLRKLADLRKAELAQTRMEKRLAIPYGDTGHVASPELRQEMRLGASSRIDRAAEQLAKALGAEATAVQAAGVAARQRAMVGASLASQVQPISALDMTRNRMRQIAEEGIQAARVEARETERRTRAENTAAERQARERQKALDEINKGHYKRAQAETRILAAQEAADLEGQRQAGIYSQFTKPFAAPDLSTKVGLGQDAVNKAELAYAIAANSRADLLAKGNATAIQMLRSDAALDAATRAVTATRAKLAIAESHASHSTNPIGRTRDQFMSGFRGQSDMPYAQQIGQAFKFSVFYGTAYKLLFALTTTLTATLQEGIKFEQAMTELKIASGASADAANDMAEGLSRQATAAGQAPSVGIEIGARSLGLFGATEAAGATQAEQQRVMDISARTVSRMALGSDLPIQELQTQLAAVANAFGGGGAASQIRAADLDAYLGRQFSTQQGQILQAVAESANVGQAAGFSQEEVSAIAGAMISRTGQSSSTAAGWMAQIFSRGGEGSLTAVTGRYGIDPNAELATQIAELAQIYKTASSSEQSEILASFGRGKVQNAAEVLLGGYDEIIAAADRSRTESRGEAERVSDLRLADIGGQIQLTVAAMQAFASELGKSGVLDILGAGVIAFRELTEAATGVLRAWNEIPGSIKSAIAALALFTIAARSSAGASALGMLGGLTGRSAASRGVNLGAVMAPYGGAAGSTGEAVRGAGSGAARNLLSSAGPWVAAAAGLYAIGELVNTTKALADAEESAADTLNALAEDNTPDAFRSRAAELQSRAKVSREAADGSWMNDVVPVLRGQADDARAQASEMEMEAQRLEAAAKVVENAAADLTPGRQGAITGFDEESLTASLDAITRSGGSAEDRLRALNDALEGTANAAAAFTPELFAAQQGETLVGLLGENITGITGKNMTPNAVREALSGFGGSPESAIQNALFGAGVADAGDLNLAAADKAARELVGKTEGSSGYVGTAEYEKAVKIVRDFLMQKTRDARIMVDAAISLTPEEAMLQLNATLAASSDVRANLQETDYRGAVRNSRALVRSIRALAARTQGGPTSEMSEQLILAQRQVAEDQFHELENMRRAQQRAAKSKAEIARIGQRFLRRELRAAIRGGNQDILAEIIGQAGAGAVRIARQIIQEAINAARAARAAYLQILAVQREAQSALGAELEFARGGVNALPDAAKVPEAIKQMQQSVGNMQTAAPGENVYQLGSDLPGYEAPKAPEKKSKEDRAAEREAARQEMLELKNNLYLLSIDLTDPLAQATAAVKDARRRLQSDIASGQDRNTVVASRLALRQAQNEREATAFQQRLDAITTAEELGRVSHRKYMSYLQNERRRLNGIKDRTFQQQQQLDQIDRLMKDAADSMQGMWNFGDIKLPTPYQVRRQVEQMQGVSEATPYSVTRQMSQMKLDRATQLDAASRQAANQSTIYIDGADTGKVRQIINEVLDKSNATVANRPRRR